MAFAAKRSLLMAALCVLSAVVLAVAAQTANAHSGHQHPSQPTEQTADLPRADAALWTSSLSVPCPGRPGAICGCGNLFLRVGGGKTAVAPCSAWNLPVGLSDGATGPAYVSVAPPSKLSLSQACPRAPPLFS